MITYWAPGRRFSDAHCVALRYETPESAAKRMSDDNFPKEASISSQYCAECNVYHITRQSTLSPTLNI